MAQPCTAPIAETKTPTTKTSGLAWLILFAKKAKELKEAAGKRQLEPPQQPTFSITDRTTNLLPVDAKKK